MERYKTMHQNFAEMHPMVCAQNSIEVLNIMLDAIKQLDRYESDYGDSLALAKEGDYIKLEDVLTLFSAKKL